MFDLWHNVIKLQQPPLSRTEQFIWELAAIQHGPARTELLLNLKLMPNIMQSIGEQVQELGQACQSFLNAEQLPRLLRLVRLVCSVLNKENIKGFCLCALHNLRDTRCVTAQATLEDYVAHVAPLVGIDFELIDLEMKGFLPAATIPIEPLQQSLIQLSRMVQQSNELWTSLPHMHENESVEAELSQIHISLQNLEHEASYVLKASQEIKTALPGSGSVSNIANTLYRFVHRLCALPHQRSVQAISQKLTAGGIVFCEKSF